MTVFFRLTAQKQTCTIYSKKYRNVPERGAVMVKMILIASNKGGVTKTTSTVILAELLVAVGYKVLVVDLDSQGNATQMLTGDSIYKYTGRSVLEAIKEQNPKQYMVQTKENLYLLPAEDMLATFSRYIYTSNIQYPMKVIKQTLERIENDFDFVFLDCPPNLGDIVLNSVVYTDYVIVPVDSGSFGLDALDRFVDFINGAREEGHTHAELLGVVMTLRDGRSKHEKDVVTEIRAEYGDLVFGAEIRRLTKIKEMAAQGVDPQSKEHLTALADYLQLVEEVIERVEQ